MGSSDNVILGVGRIYMAPLGSPIPSQQWSWPSEWSELGYTTKGVSLEVSNILKITDVDQEQAPLYATLMNQRVIVRTRLVEATLANLQRSIGSAALMETEEELNLGGGTISGMMLGVEGMAPSGQARTIIIYNGAPVFSIDLKMARGSVTSFPLTLLARYTEDGFTEIIDGTPADPSDPGVTNTLLIHEGYTASGSQTGFDLDHRKVSGSDPLVFINGVLQDPDLGYSVVTYPGYSKIAFNFTPASGDKVNIWYQKEVTA